MTFRLLDERVGWDPREPDGLSGVILEGGTLMLSRTATPMPPDHVLPPRLAWMCETCAWWLATDAGVQRLGPCDPGFVMWREGGPVRALAARGPRLALALDNAIEIVRADDGRLTGRAALPGVTALSLTPWGTLLAGGADGILHELDLSGIECGRTDAGGPIGRIAHPPAEPCRTVVIHDDGSVSGGTIGELGPTGVSAATALGFCLEDRGCFAWNGTALDAGALGSGEAIYGTAGQYLSAPLDSGIPGCRWHRVRVDSDVPAGTALELAVATTDGPVDARPPQPDADGFPGGDPHPDDWTTAPAGTTDWVLRTPPGRHAYVRIRLRGDGTATPVVYQLRLDLPRRTSFDDLPGVFSEDPSARDFGERFASLFDAQLEEVDEAIARRHALLDSAALPDDALAWLAGLLGLGFEAEMTSAQRRTLIDAAPDLFRRRGTPSGLVDTLAVALGIDAAVRELGPERPWGAAGAARLGEVRLFGRSRARVRLGTSRLGSAPLLSRGNPDDDARLSGANRIEVTVPAGSLRALVERVVRSQTPSHVVATVRMHEPGLVLTDLRLGIDTVLASPAPAVVGAIRLGRTGVLRRGRAASPFVLGRPAIVGSTTRTE